jgi:DNA-binding NtrC family response regulator
MHTKTILLVDDNAVQAAVRQAILKRNGYFVIAVLNPARALEQLRNGDFLNEINLVITDHIMPGMSGSTFVREVRTLRPQIPVLVISGLEEACAEYEELNVEFRVKPLQPQYLLESVEELVGGSGDAEVPLSSTIAPATA